MIARVSLSVWTCFVVLSPVTAAAQGASHQLDYRGPADCPDAARFTDEVAARVGYLPFGAAGDRAEVRILRDDGGATIEFVGTLALGADAPRAFRSGDCNDLVGTMAAALAVALDASSAPLPPPMVAPPPPAPAAPPGRVRVRVNAPDGRPLTLHRVTGRQMATIATNDGVAYGFGMSFQDVCEAPCEGEVDAGSYELAISRPGGTPVPAPDRYRLEQDSEISLSYVDNEGLRIAGWVTMIAGLSVGLGVGLGSMGLPDDWDNDCYSAYCGPNADLAMGMLIGGSVVAGVSAIAGLILTWMGDGSSVTVSPLTRL